MSLLPEDDVQLDSPSGESIPPQPSRRRSSIKENLRRNALVEVADEKSVQPVTERKIPAPVAAPLQAPAAFEEPFWERKSVVFVSWYWPSCILVGIGLGFSLADLVT